MPSLAQREFNIAAGDLVEFSIVPQLVEQLGKDAPGIVVRMTHVPEGDLALQLLESGELDVIMSSQPLKGMGVHNETLTDISLATLIWKQERLTKRRFPMALYLKRPHVIIRMPDRQGSIVDQTLAGLGLQRPIGAVVQNFMTMPMVAARTGYICNVPSRMATMFAELFDLSVHEPPIDFAATPRLHVVAQAIRRGSGARVAVAAGPQYGAVAKAAGHRFSEHTVAATCANGASLRTGVSASYTPSRTQWRHHSRSIASGRAFHTCPDAHCQQSGVAAST